MEPAKNNVQQDSSLEIETIDVLKTVVLINGEKLFQGDAWLLRLLVQKTIMQKISHICVYYRQVAI